jgi:hypothetical protein
VGGARAQSDSSDEADGGSPGVRRAAEFRARRKSERAGADAAEPAERRSWRDPTTRMTSHYMEEQHRREGTIGGGAQSTKDLISKVPTLLPRPHRTLVC